jgi:DNA/RNA endonuclease G (NUC1)
VIGYQTQMFVNGGSTDQGGMTVGSADVSWTSSDPSILTIDNRGVVTAVADGQAMLIGTAPDGSAGWFILSTEVPFYSTTARAGHNTELGVPTDGDISNDVMIQREEYTISYNPQRGGPNWVSWNLSSTHLGSRDRCNCYSADTALARLGFGQYMYNTADYTNGGYDRGHMEPSADQTTTDGENARTFFLTNFLPQQHNLNAGPWEALENDLRDSVKAGREAYVIAGGVFTHGVGLGSLKGEGKIFIPDSTWKIVVLMPANDGLANVTSPSDIDVIAVNMPNVANQPTNDWTVYRTSVQAIQRSTEYDFLSALPRAIQDAVENHAPVVNPFTGETILAGETYTASGTFTDLDRDPWTASVDYRDGTRPQTIPLSGMSFTLSHAYASAGSFSATVTVSDGRATGSGSATVTVQSPADGIANLDDALATLSGGSLGGGLFAAATVSPTSTTPQPLNSGELESLRTKLTSANSQLAAGKATPAANMVNAFANELQSMVQSGRVAAATGQPIIAYAARVVASIRKS